MFGISAYAQTPFAALGGGNSFVFAVTEDVSMADANSQVWSFLQAITEPIILSDLNSDAGIYIGSIVELSLIHI